ncbi:MAG: PHP domain-containing protein [Opitutae bacterium]|nr:PHP domain-containing protein [Opitutae bacterium]
MKKTIITLTFVLLVSNPAFGHGSAEDPPADNERKITFPDTPQYKTLVLDPHTHTVFSDGHVWPRIRVGEALRDGLDALAITDHLEFQPHLEDIPHPDRNRAYLDAKSSAEGTPLIVVPGVEITRSAPASHMNAIFIKDANALFRPPVPSEPYDRKVYTEKAEEWPPQLAVEAANEQGAFVFWNHAYWTRDFPTGIPIMPEFHRKNVKNGLLHGIEIANGQSYSEHTFQMALGYNLTLIGVSDVHNLIDWDYEPHLGGHRPVTLVLAKEKTSESIKEALFDRRTVVWFKNNLMGRPQHLGPLLEASLSLHDASYRDGEILHVSITNTSDADFHLRNKSTYSFFHNTDQITIRQHSTEKIRVKTGTRIAELELDFEVLNAFTAPKQTASLKLRASVE